MRAAEPILIAVSMLFGAVPAGAQPQPPQGAAMGATSSTRSTPSTASEVQTGTSVFLGGVPTGRVTAEPIKLTVIDAVLRALDHNLGVLTAEQEMGHARGSRWLALADLLPNVSLHLSETKEKINLAAFGFGGGGGAFFPGVPDVVGPFYVFDARFFLSQSVYDLEALNSVRQETHLVEAARLTHRSARDFVIHVAGDAFIQALAASARADAARAQLETADALNRQALDLKQNGMVAGIDVLRAQVQLNLQQTRVTAATTDFEKTKLVLARLVGLPLGQPFTLDPNLPELPVSDQSLDQAVEFAYRTRPDYRAALERVHAAEAERASVAGSHLPSVHLNADIGQIGLTPSGSKNTFTVAGTLNVPIFDGGRTRGRLLQADTDLRERAAEAEDLKASIYYEVRTALLDLQATSEQLRAATAARDLAAEQLTQARDRFGAGVANNIDIVQAQEAVALATEQFISAQYGYDLAKGSLIRGTGTSEEILRQIIGGVR